MESNNLKENVILIDADYVDSVAFNLMDNFQRMLYRDIPSADLAEWLVCLALDGGVPQGKNVVQCIFLHSKEKLMLEQFNPGELAHEIDGTVFYDPVLGEFQMSCICKEELAGDDLLAQCAEVALGTGDVKRLILAPDMDLCEESLRRVMVNAPEDKKVTLLSMVPYKGFEHVMLGFSLMHAMGIKGEEL